MGGPPSAGALGNETPAAAIASVTVQQCSATDLAPALGTMLTRLFPHIFRVRAGRDPALRAAHNVGTMYVEQTCVVLRGGAYSEMRSTRDDSVLCARVEGPTTSHVKRYRFARVPSLCNGSSPETRALNPKP